MKIESRLEHQSKDLLSLFEHLDHEDFKERHERRFNESSEFARNFLRHQAIKYQQVDHPTSMMIKTDTKDPSPGEDSTDS